MQLAKSSWLTFGQLTVGMASASRPSLLQSSRGDRLVVWIRQARVIDRSLCEYVVEVAPVRIEALHRCVRRSAMPGHQHVGAAYHLREAIEPGEIARQIGLAGVGVGQLDVAEHVAREQDARVDDLDGEMTAGVGVVRVQHDVAASPGQVGGRYRCHASGEIDEIVGDVADEGLDQRRPIGCPPRGGPVTCPARDFAEIGMPQHVVVVQMRREPGGAARACRGEEARDAGELVRIPARIDDERLELVTLTSVVVDGDLKPQKNADKPALKLAASNDA